MTTLAKWGVAEDAQLDQWYKHRKAESGVCRIGVQLTF